MSTLAKFRALEAELAAQLQQLDVMKKDSKLKKDLEFEDKVKTLMDEYGISTRQLIGMLDPERANPVKTSRKERTMKVYMNPETTEIVETKGGNNKVLKMWREKYGVAAVESWLQK